MNHSKNIQEKIKLYNINLIRNKKFSIQKTKKINFQQNQNVVQKKHSKFKIFFKFLLGFIGSFFEHLVIESNKKNFANTNKNTSNLVLNINKIDIENKDNNNYPNKKIIIKEKNIKQDIEKDIKNNVECKKTEENTNDYIKKNEIINNSVKKDTKGNQFINGDTNTVTIVDEKKGKNNLILIEEQIIYADTKEELNDAEVKINTLKNNLIVQKQNNVLALNNLDNEKVKHNEQTQNDQLLFQNHDNQKEYQIDDNIKRLNDKENIAVDKNDNSTFIEENIFISKKTEVFIENNIVIDKLIKRCDEDLVLVSEKKDFLNLQENFEKNFNNETTKQKINKKDLKRIKDNVLEIVEKQKENLKQFNDFMKEPYDSTMFSLKLSNFFKSTAKLAFSFVPFFSFPNRIFGLATSALFFNRSIKSYRIKPNKNDINQSIRSMINNNEFCLRIGISNCNDSLNEIENIKYYLKNLSSEAKDSIEYRKYLLSVESTERLIQKQIEFMKNLSKKYDDIKIKVKKREN